mgnify:CR=1 FL=1
MTKIKLKIPNKRKLSLFESVVMVLLILYGVAVIGLLLWGFISSFRNDQAVVQRPWAIFQDLTLDNYSDVFNNFKTFKYVDGGTQTVYFEEMFLNSLLYAGGGALMQTLCTAIVAYLTAKYDNTCSKIVHYTVIVTLTLPIVGNLASMLQVTKSLKLFDSIVGSWIMKFGFNNIYYLIFYAFFKKISWEYAESAFLDGGSHYTVFFRIMLPLAMPLMATVFLLNFIQYWNDFETPYMFLPNHTTAGIMLYMSIIGGGGSWAGEGVIALTSQLAAAFLVFLPIFVLFLVFRNKIMGNLSEGGIKG